MSIRRQIARCTTLTAICLFACGAPTLSTKQEEPSPPAEMAAPPAEVNPSPPPGPPGAFKSLTPADDWLIGTWAGTENPGHEFQMTFRIDGTFEQLSWGQLRFAGTYEVHESALVLTSFGIPPRTVVWDFQMHDGTLVFPVLNSLGAHEGLVGSWWRQSPDFENAPDVYDFRSDNTVTWTDQYGVHEGTYSEISPGCFQGVWLYASGPGWTVTATETFRPVGDSFASILYHRVTL